MRVLLVEPYFGEAARGRLGERVVHFGYADDGGYAKLLRSADIVVSTARHEFFGVAIVEAIYAGAWPVLPNRLSYPGHIPEPYAPRCSTTTSRGWSIGYAERSPWRPVPGLPKRWPPTTGRSWLRPTTQRLTRC